MSYKFFFQALEWVLSEFAKPPLECMWQVILLEMEYNLQLKYNYEVLTLSGLAFINCFALFVNLSDKIKIRTLFKVYYDFCKITIF